MELLTFSVSCCSKSAVQFSVCGEQNVTTAVSHTRHDSATGTTLLLSRDACRWLRSIERSEFSPVCLFNCLSVCLPVCHPSSSPSSIQPLCLSYSPFCDKFSSVKYFWSRCPRRCNLNKIRHCAAARIRIMSVLISHPIGRKSSWITKTQ